MLIIPLHWEGGGRGCSAEVFTLVTLSEIMTAFLQ